MVEQELLFAGHVDTEVGVGLVQVVEGEPGQLGHLADQPAVDPRLLKGRVGEQD